MNKRRLGKILRRVLNESLNNRVYRLSEEEVVQEVIKQFERQMKEFPADRDWYVEFDKDEADIEIVYDTLEREYGIQRKDITIQHFPASVGLSPEDSWGEATGFSGPKDKMERGQMNILRKMKKELAPHGSFLG